MKKFICQSKLEINDKCDVQCKHCKEYFGELEEQISIETQLDIEQQQNEMLIKELEDYKLEIIFLEQKNKDLINAIEFLKSGINHLSLGFEVGAALSIDRATKLIQKYK